MTSVLARIFPLALRSGVSVNEAAAIVAATPALSRPVLVGVDGVDGSGKTTYATRLSLAYRAAGREAQVVHLDDYLNPPSIRYRRGRDSPEGFFEDSYDLDRFRDEVLEALRGPVTAGPDIIVVEGLFLHRDELWSVWDLSVFLEVPFAVSVARLAARDGSHPDPDHPSMHRYVQGQRIYLSACRPLERATFVVDNG